MKSTTMMLLGLVALLLVSGGYYVITKGVQQETSTISDASGGNNRNQKGSGFANDGAPNRNNCVADDCLLVEDLEYPAADLPVEVVNSLETALEDEYKALATYEAVMEQFGTVRPFSMIKGAEAQHIASLHALFDKYGLEYEDNAWLGQVEAPATLQAACQTGVDAEIANAALYREDLLPTVIDYPDITAIYQNLMSASENKHLPAFERCN